MCIKIWADREVQVHRLAGIYPAFFVLFYTSMRMSNIDFKMVQW